MISRQFATLQIRRLAGFERFPKEYPEAIAELIKAAMTARSEAECVSVIDSMIEDWERCPRPAEIRRAMFAAGAMTEEQALAARRAACSQCKGSGWIYTEKNGLSGAEKCECSLVLSDTEVKKEVKRVSELKRLM